MPNTPAVLISDDLIGILTNEALYQLSFVDLTGTNYPWEVSYNILNEIKNKLKQAEEKVRSSNPEEDMTCVISGNGAHWLTLNGLNTFVQELQNPISKLKTDGPLPIWKMTTAELIFSHISNMRRLLLIACHDLVLLEQMKDHLGKNHEFLQREFQLCERSVRRMIEEMEKQSSTLGSAVSSNIVLLERIRITNELVERGEKKIEELGYSKEELLHAQDVLEKKCEKELPAFRQRIQSIFNQMLEALREGENTLLSRAGRWEMTFAMIGTPPGFKGYSIISEKERQALTPMVSSREEELGKSQSGSAALEVVDEVRSAKGEISEPVKEEETEPPPEEMDESAKKKKMVQRMAFQNRSRH